MSLTIPNLLDIVLLLIMLGTALNYLRKGFLAGVTEMFGTLIAVITALFFSLKASPWFFEKFFKTNFAEQVSNKLATTAETMLTSDIVKDVLSFLPSSVVEKLMEGKDSLIAMVDPSTPGLAAELVDEIIAPIVTPLLSIIMFFVVLIVAKLLVSFIVALFANVNDVPGVGSLNKWMGFATGAVVGLLNVYIIVVALSAVATLTGNQIPIINTTFLNESFFGGLFHAINPFQ